MIKLCVFDLDGTLFNSVESLRYPSNETLKHFGLDPISPEETMRFVGNGYRTLVKRFMHLRGNDDENDYKEACEFFSEVFAKDPSRGVVMYDGIRESLEFIKSCGIKMAVLSNKTDARVRDVVIGVCGEGVFDAIYGEREGIPIKPDPTSLKLLMEEFSVKPNEVLYFGDTDVDMNTAAGGECIAVGCSWGYRSRESIEAARPRYLIDSPYQIPDIIISEMKTVYLRGAQMPDKEAFYEGVISELTENIDFKPGHNLDAFADLVSGGFGKHAPGEALHFVWYDYDKAEKSLGREFTGKVIGIIKAEGCVLTIA